MKAFGYSIATGEAPHPDDLFQPRFQRVGESLHSLKTAGCELGQWIRQFRDSLATRLFAKSLELEEFP